MASRSGFSSVSPASHQKHAKILPETHQLRTRNILATCGLSFATPAFRDPVPPRPRPLSESSEAPSACPMALYGQGHAEGAPASLVSDRLPTLSPGSRLAAPARRTRSLCRSGSRGRSAHSIHTGDPFLAASSPSISSEGQAHAVWNSARPSLRAWGRLGRTRIEARQLGATGDGGRRGKGEARCRQWF